MVRVSNNKTAKKKKKLGFVAAETFSNWNDANSLQ
jgi:hypothetical protein